MTLRTGEDTVIWRRKLWLVLCGGIVLEEALDLSSDRILNEWTCLLWCHRVVWKVGTNVSDEPTVSSWEATKLEFRSTWYMTSCRLVNNDISEEPNFLLTLLHLPLSPLFTSSPVPIARRLLLGFLTVSPHLSPPCHLRIWILFPILPLVQHEFPTAAAV